MKYYLKLMGRIIKKLCLFNLRFIGLFVGFLMTAGGLSVVFLGRDPEAATVMLIVGLIMAIIGIYVMMAAWQGTLKLRKENIILFWGKSKLRDTLRAFGLVIGFCISLFGAGAIFILTTQIDREIRDTSELQAYAIVILLGVILMLISIKRKAKR